MTGKLERVTQAVLGGLGVGAVVWADGPLHVNGAARRLFLAAYPPAGPAGVPQAASPLPLERFFTAATLPSVRETLARGAADADAQAQCEAQALWEQHDGPWLRLSAASIPWGGGRAVLLTCMPLEMHPHRERAPGSQRDLLQAVFDTIPHNLVVKDAELRYVAVNRAMAQDFGREPEEFVGYTTYDLPFLSDSQRKAFLETDRPVIETGETFTVPALAFTDHTGREVVWRFTKRPLRDASGAVVGLVGESEDLTVRYRAEEALRDQQRMLQSILDQLPVAVWVTDLERRHIVVNRLMARYCGLEAEALLGTRLEDLPGLPDRLREQFAAQDQEVLATGRAIDLPEVPLTLTGGRTAWRRVLKAPMRDEHGRIVGLIGISQDVTRRVLAERERVELAAALGQAGDAIFITDLDGRIRYVNSAFEQITGYRRQEVLGQTPRVLKSGRQPHEFYTRVWETLRGGESWQGRYVNRRKDGTTYHVHSTHSPIRDAGGAITGFLSLQRDISQQVEMDERMRRSQRMEALGTLSGGIAHDFNNLLVPVMGFTELLQQRVPTESEEYHWIQMIAEAAGRARDLVARILLFSRQTERDPVPMSLAPIVAEVLGFMRATVPASIRLRERLDSDGWIQGDPAQIHQVLMNLCVNAVQAMPDGGVLRIELELCELSALRCYLGALLTGSYVRLTVRDTGVGMSEATLSRIFEPFYTTKEVGEGTGLGLSTAIGIVTSHGGAMRVESTPGQGSAFHVYLPAIVPKDPAAAVPQDAAARGEERVLVVDDEAAISELVRATLVELGYRVTALTDSREARRRLEEDPAAFDALVTDQTMPYLTGLELARDLRARNARIPIVLCTGHGDAVQVEPAESPLSALVQKPFRPSDLARLLRRLLDQRERP